MHVQSTLKLRFGGTGKNGCYAGICTDCPYLNLKSTQPCCTLRIHFKDFDDVFEAEDVATWHGLPVDGGSQGTPYREEWDRAQN